MFVDRSDFEYIEMDTDSAYIALSGPKLESVIKPELIDKFYEVRNKWLPSPYCEAHADDFKKTEQAGQSWTRTHDDEDNFCSECRKSKMFTKRTPGLFKVEWRGKGMIALCSKTYYGFGNVEDDKVSTKGIIKHQQDDLNPAAFREVLHAKKAGTATNLGFRPVGNQVWTYSQDRDALSYMYIKRKVCEDNVSTLPLDI